MLVQTLALKTAQDANAVADATAHELKKLGHDLQLQSASVLTTTSIAITQSAAREMQSAEQQIEHLKQQMRNQLSMLQMQSETLQSELRQQILMQQEQNAALQQQLMLRQQQLQEQMNQQLQPLSDDEMKARMASLQKQINQQAKPLTDALNTIARESQGLATMTAKSWLKPVLISLAVLLSISVPVWGLAQYLASQMQGNLVLIQQQERAIQQHRETLQQLQSKTWGVQFQEDANGRFLVLPPGVEGSTGWKVGNRHAVKIGKK
jgi:hypothetical protein